MTTKLDAIRQRARGPLYHPVPPAAASYRNVLRSQEAALMGWATAVAADIPALLAVVEVVKGLGSDQCGDMCPGWYGDPCACGMADLRAALAPLLEPEG